MFCQRLTISELGTDVSSVIWDRVLVNPPSNPGARVLIPMCKAMKCYNMLHNSLVMNNENCQHHFLSCFYDCLISYYYRNTNIYCIFMMLCAGSLGISRQIIKAIPDIFLLVRPVAAPQSLSQTYRLCRGWSSLFQWNIEVMFLPIISAYLCTPVQQRLTDWGVFVVMEDQSRQHWTCGCNGDLCRLSKDPIYIFLNEIPRSLFVTDIPRIGDRIWYADKNSTRE